MLVRLITVWLEVRVLPGPPRSLSNLQFSWRRPRSPQLAGSCACVSVSAETVSGLKSTVMVVKATHDRHRCDAAFVLDGTSPSPSLMVSRGGCPFCSPLYGVHRDGKSKKRAPMTPINPADEFLKHAAECQQMAKATRNPASKATWDRMAVRWLQCAERAKNQKVATRARVPVRRQAEISSAHY